MMTLRQRALQAVALLLFLTTTLAIGQESQPPGPLTGFTVCIDPGHGGQGLSASYTGGMTGGETGLTESEASLNIALLLRERFRRDGAKVIMTRTEDRRVTPEGTSADAEQRARLEIAHASNADLLISVHTSFSADRTINATQVFYEPETDRREAELGWSIGQAVSSRIGTIFRGPKVQAYKVIHEAPMPAIIVEAASLSNPEQELRLKSLTHCRDIAGAIYAGFRNDYLRQHPGTVWPMAEEPPLPAMTPRSAPTPTPQPTAAPKATPVATARPAARATQTPGPRPTMTPTPTPRLTPRATPTPVPTMRATPRPTPTATPKVTPRPTPSATVAPGRAEATPRPIPPIRRATPTPSPTPKVAIRITPRPTPTPVPTPAEGDDVRRAMRPMLLNPAGGPIDQAWLFGEQYGELPLQRGVSFNVPEGTIMSAAAAGFVEAVAPPGVVVPPGDMDLAPEYDGWVILRHGPMTLPDGSEQEVYTVYGNLSRVLVNVGEKVAANDPLGKTRAPYDGRPRSRERAPQFEVRAGDKTPFHALNPEWFIRPIDPANGAITFRITDAQGFPLEGVEIRGVTKDTELFPRYAFSISYGRSVKSLPGVGENAYIGDVPPGLHVLEMRGVQRTVRVESGKITEVEWSVGP